MTTETLNKRQKETSYTTTLKAASWDLIKLEKQLHIVLMTKDFIKLGESGGFEIYDLRIEIRE